VWRSVAASVAVSLGALAATVGQAVSLARVLAGLFAHATLPAGALEGLVAFSALRVALALLGEPVGSSLAAPVRRDLRRRSLLAVLDGRGELDPDALVQLTTRGVDAIEQYLAGYVPALVLAGLAPVALIAWLAATDWLSALIVASTVALLPVFMVLLGLEAKAAMLERWRDQSRLAGYFGDVVAGMATLKAHNRSRQAVDSLQDAGRAFERSTMATLRVAFLSGFALELLASVATALVALVLGLRLLDGSLALSSALAILLVTPEVYLPLRRAAAKFHGATDGVGAADAVLDLVAGPARAVGTRPAPAGAPRIELVGARATRAGRDHHSLEALSVAVPAGTVLAIEGPSGVGKSTLLRAVAGLGELGEGQILVDGVPLGELAPAGWHAVAGWLAQDPVVPGATVAEALRLGRTGLGDDELRAVLDELGLDLDLDRPLGERADTLSAGQRRRLALARCLLGRPSVLVLDEPTAHLDERAAQLVTAAIRRRGATTLVATHRPFPADQTVALAAPERFRA
jgi:ABC-type transport system involved in cytochrome bd biosynthesis fused ATPase/permease subunit